MKTKYLTLILLLLTCGIGRAQTCETVAVAAMGGWKSARSAPHDGSTVETLETFGVAPTYALARWSKEMRRWDILSSDPPHQSFINDDCLFWRPYKRKGKYIDPTNGAQNTIPYWCAWIHRPYDKKTDACY